MENLRVLYIAEIVGKSGVFCVKTLLPRLREEFHPHIVIGNADGATGGFGMGKNHSIYLHKLGIDVMSSGECIYYKRDMVAHLAHAPYVLRAANYPPGNPGRGWLVYQAGNMRVAVISMLGVSGFLRTHLNNPFHLLDRLVERVRGRTNYCIMDFHAATTAEKVAMFHHADGKLSAVIGSHAKVPTSDEHVYPGGTAAITDAGRTGSFLSVGGLDPDIEVEKFVTQIYARSRIAWQGLEIQGVYLEIGAHGRAVEIRRIRRACAETGTESMDERDGSRQERAS